LYGPYGIILIIILVIPFVFLGTSSLGTGFSGSFGSINGEDVSEIDMQIASSSAIQRFKRLYGEDFDFDSLDNDFKTEAVKQELIIQKVLLSEARELGFVNDNTVNSVKKNIMQSPIFQLDGVFSEDLYEAQVNSNGYTKEGYIEVMTNLSAGDLYRSSLNVVDFVLENEKKNLINLLETSADINFIKISFDGLKKEIVNSPDELKQYYNQNEILFFSEEERNFQYFIIDQSSYIENIEIPYDYLQNAYNNYLENFNEDAQIRISHIMIEKNNYDSRDIALDSIKNIENLLSEGKEFFEIAKQYSEDIVTKDSGGDLEFFEKDIFPIEFDEAIEDLDLNEISEIVELADSFHIIKVTEKNIQTPLPKDQITNELEANLIETESYALMQDDVLVIEDLISKGISLDQISKDMSKEIFVSEFFTKNNFDFDIDSSELKDFVFSDVASTDEANLINLDDRLIVVSINEVINPSLNSFEQSKNEVSELLSEFKTKEKISLLNNEINSFLTKDEKNKFIDSYNYVTNESYVDVKRYSSLLPREILIDIFENSSDSSLSSEARNGDKYLIDIIKFNKPSDEKIESLINEYDSYNKEIIINNMSQIVNEDIFQNASVNLKEFIL
jgi:peptidyl-prolyl cis-trans isomerase D